VQEVAAHDGDIRTQAEVPMIESGVTDEKEAEGRIVQEVL